MDKNKLTDNPIWSIGFRPFFLFGTLTAVFLLAIWLFFQGGLIIGLPYYDPITWHGHEMVFGFTSAIITGFLLTSSANWSGKEGIKGTKLKILFFLWLTARILPFFNVLNYFTAIVDLSFLPLAVYFLFPYIGTEKQRKNQGFLVFLTLMFIGNLMVHLNMLNVVEGIARKGLLLGIDSIILIISLISGRIFPFFTRNAVKNAKVKNYKPIEFFAIFSAGVFLIGELISEGSVFVGVIALIAAFFHSIRWLCWNPWQTRKLPILWILYLGYFWIIAGFILKGLDPFIGFLPGIAIHTWTVGGISMLIFGMISRVSLGHTGRIIKAGRLIVTAYLLLNLSVIIRVGIPIFLPEWYLKAIFYSGFVWIISYILFLAQYWQILTGPRADGKPG